MAIGLNKRQLQETLREMGVDFPSKASRDDLEIILGQANQKQWLRMASNNSGGRNGRIIRRRGRNLQQTDEKIDPSQTTVVAPEIPPSAPPGPKAEYAPWQIKTTAPPSKPKAREHAKVPVFDRTQGLETYALDRAKGVCDLCEKRPTDKNDGQPVELTPCFFIDPPEAKPHTMKTVAALCPQCLERIRATPSPSDIRLLKRKARQTRVNEVTITKKKKPPRKGKKNFARYRK